MAALAPGTLIDRTWRLVRPLGQGGMGVVWAAEHAQLGRTAALKFLRVEFAGDEKSLLRFRQEAVAASRIGSPHIVAMLDSGTAPDGSPFLAMELLEGETLWEAMDGGTARLPVPRAADILGQTLTGIGAAHAQGIVHRDLKPENIFLTRLSERPDFVKLLDFGLARVRSGDTGTRLTKTGVLLGTPSYMAPEQILGAKDADHRADLWSVGVILFRCLTGRRPFDGATPADRIAAVVSRPPTPLRAVRPDLDDRLASIVQRALARRPEDRFQTADELRQALVPYAAGCASPYATSSLAPAMLPPSVPSSFPPPGISPVPSSPGAVPAAAVASPATSWPGLPPATRPPAAAPPRRLWLLAVAVAAVILAGAGIGWLIARDKQGSPGPTSVADVGVGVGVGVSAGGGRTVDVLPVVGGAVGVSVGGGPAADPALAGLSDHELYVRVNVDLSCPGPDGMTPSGRFAAQGHVAVYEAVLGKYGLDMAGWAAVATRVAPDEAVFAEIRRRILECDLPGLPSDPAALRELYLTVWTDFSCANVKHSLDTDFAEDEQQARILPDTLARHGLTQAQFDALNVRFATIEEVRAEQSRRLDACVDRLSTESGVDPNAVLPPLQAPVELPAGGTGDAERDLFVLLAAEAECRTRLVTSSLGEYFDLHPLIEKQVLIAHDRTLSWSVDQAETAENDPAIEVLIGRLVSDCVTRNRGRGNARNRDAGSDTRDEGEGANDASDRPDEATPSTGSTPSLNVRLH